MHHALSRFCLNLLLVTLAICHSPLLAAQATAPVADNAIQTLLTRGEHPWLRNSSLAAELATLKTLYQSRDFAPLWFKQGRPTAQALQLLDVLRGAARYGLRADDYDGIALTNQLVQLTNITDPNQATRNREQVDVGLSTAALRLVRHLHFGRIDPVKAGFDLKVSRSQEFDAVKTLGELADSEDISGSIGRFEPRFAHYHLLKAALARYRLLTVDAELTQLPPWYVSSSRAKPEGSRIGPIAAAEQDIALPMPPPIVTRHWMQHWSRRSRPTRHVTACRRMARWADRPSRH
jgi:murein L,D-transpeptidase YcbB/YkuD